MHATGADLADLDDDLRLVTLPDAARFLSVSRGSLYDLLTTGQRASVHIGRSRRIPLGEIRRYVRDRLQRDTLQVRRLPWRRRRRDATRSTVGNTLGGAVDYWLGRGRLERIDGSTAGESSATIIGRATRRLLTADGGLAAGDVEGAFAAAYDAYRMAAEALLIRQGLRATGGEGSHVTVEDAISGQFAKAIPGLAKPTFERLRRTRHAAQYFDPSSDRLPFESGTVVEEVERLLRTDPPELFA